MNLATTIEHMLDALSDSMYESQLTYRATLETPAEYEMFCTICHVMQDTHPSDTDCSVGQIEHKLREILSLETN